MTSSGDTPLSTTPAQDGFFARAETDPHGGVWILWPERADNWRDGARPAQLAFAFAASAIAEYEPVVVAASPNQSAHARATLPSAVRVVELPSDDSWMRDVAPSFVVNRQGEVRGVHWHFNAYGGQETGLYKDWAKDAQVAQHVQQALGLSFYAGPLVLEGGAIHVDGEGTLITTESCLLDPHRNPGLTRNEAEAVLKSYFGVSAIVWLERGLAEDETGGHIDNIACFPRPGAILLAWTDDPADRQFDIVREAEACLRHARDAQGREFEILKLHLPPPLYRTDAEASGVAVVPGTRRRRGGDLLTASYVNSYVANGAVIMPLFDCAADERARSVLARAYPGRVIRGVLAREIVLGGGGIHCITHEIPRG